jgi:hypothetical protein
VRLGRNPLVHVWPRSVDVANPIDDAPPPRLNRPAWKALTTVAPKAKVSGSTSVACWLASLVKGSLLTRWIRRTADAEELGEAEPPGAPTRSLVRLRLRAIPAARADAPIRTSASTRARRKRREVIN